MDMRRCFVHMKVRREHSQIWIAFLETLIVFVRTVSARRALLLPTYLPCAKFEDDLIGTAFPAFGLDMLVVIGNLSVLAFLFIIVLFQSFVPNSSLVHTVKLIAVIL